MCDCILNTFKSQYIQIIKSVCTEKETSEKTRKPSLFPSQIFPAQHVMTRATLLDASASSRASRARDSTAAACRDAWECILEEILGAKVGVEATKIKEVTRKKWYVDSKNWELSSKTRRISGKMLGFDLRKCQFNQQGLRFNQWQHWNLSSVQGDVSTKAWHLSRNSEPIDRDTDRLGYWQWKWIFDQQECG